MLTSWHILGSRQMGGAEHFYVRLVDALQRRESHTVVAVNRGARSHVAGALNPAVEQIHLPFANKYDLFTRKRLTCAVSRRRPDIIQSYMGRATLHTRKPKRSATVHVARLGGFYKLRGYFEHPDAWIGNSRGLCDYLIQNGLPSDRVHYIGNFVPIPDRSQTPQQAAKLRREWNIPNDALTIFALGRLIHIKAFDDLLEAFSRLPATVNGRPPYLLIAGSGPDRKTLEKQAEQSGINARVRWLGWQNKPDPWFDLADFMVCPSRREALGNVILEAWSHELPVVSTRTAGALDLITDGENGLLADRDAPEDLATKLQDLLKATPQEHRRLAQSGFQSLREKHGEDTVVDAYMDLYARLTGTG